jgi:release factor glutamine methyltransferase
LPARKNSVADVGMTVAAARLAGGRSLSATPTPQLDADLLLGYVLGERREAILISEGTLTPQQLSRYESLIARRAAGEPVAYLTSTKSWYGLDVEVTPAVLIPRPETEVLVEAVIARFAHTHPATVVDIGTGSGAISIALARAFPDAQFTAVDISPAALSVAQRNASRHGVADRITWVVGSLLDPIDSAPDVIVANLPYVPTVDRHTLSPEVLQEPESALFAGSDGLDLIRALLEQVAARNWRSTICLECDPRHVDPIKEYAIETLRCSNPEVIPDLAGHNRVVIIDSGSPQAA